MPAPVISFYHDDSTPGSGTLVDDDHPLDFGTVERGMTSATVVCHLWNDKDGSAGSDAALSPRFYAINGPDSIADVFAGTLFNGYKSMLQARSCGAYGVAADQNQAWTPIGPASYLITGNIPSQARREIELRLVVPIDAVAQASAKNFQFRVSI